MDKSRTPNQTQPTANLKRTEALGFDDRPTRHNCTGHGHDAATGCRSLKTDKRLAQRWGLQQLWPVGKIGLSQFVL